MRVWCTSLWRAKKAAFSLASFSDWHWGPWTMSPLDSFTWHTTVWGERTKLVQHKQTHSCRLGGHISAGITLWYLAKQQTKWEYRNVPCVFQGAELPVCCLWSWNRAGPSLTPHRCTPAPTPYCSERRWRDLEGVKQGRHRGGRSYWLLEGVNIGWEGENTFKKVNKGQSGTKTLIVWCDPAFVSPTYV